MTNANNLAASRDGEAYDNEALWLGVPLSAKGAVEAAAQGDPAALTFLAQWALSDSSRMLYGETAALAVAECLALLAAVRGGPAEREFYAEVIERQLLTLDEDSRHQAACRRQLESIREMEASA